MRVRTSPSSSLPLPIAVDTVVEGVHSVELQGVAPRSTPAAVEAEGVPDYCEARPVLPQE